MFFTLHNQERPPSLLEAIIEDAKLDLKGIPWMFLPNRKKSLVQLFHTVHSSVDSVFATPMVSSIYFMVMIAESTVFIYFYEFLYMEQLMTFTRKTLIFQNWNYSHT